MQFTAEMIAGLLNGTVEGDKNATVSTVSSIDGGKAGSLAYLTNPKYEQYIYTTEASIVLVDKSFEPKEEVKGRRIDFRRLAALVASSAAVFAGLLIAGVALMNMQQQVDSQASEIIAQETYVDEMLEMMDIHHIQLLMK